MRRLSKTKIELDKIRKANAKQRKMARGATAPAGVRENQFLPPNAWTVALDGGADFWAKPLGSLLKLHEAANDPENLELFAGRLDTDNTIDGIRKILTANFFDGDIEERLMNMWYPDGTVTSKEQWADLKYDWDNADKVNHTVEVLPFCSTGNPDVDNSDKGGTVIIPPYADHEGVRYAVTGVAGGSPFDANTALISVVAPITFTSIGNSAFNTCTSLTSVSFPAATGIGEFAFCECPSLTSVSLPAATGIGEVAFYNCTSLTTVTLPVATSIGGDAFYNCTSLTTVTLPVATSIGGDAFYNCTSLTTVTLPAAESIGDGAFSDCTSLSALDLSSFRKDDIVSNAANWGIYLSSGQTITITASDETFTITGE